MNLGGLVLLKCDGRFMALVPPSTKTGLGSHVEGFELKRDRVRRGGRVGEGTRLTVGDSGSHLGYFGTI